MTAFYKQSWFAPVASAATSFLFPSLGSTIGGALGMTGQTADLVGNALVGAGIGGLSGGAQGALTGALAGAGTRLIAPELGLGGGYQQLLSGLGALGGGTGAAPAAAAFNGTGTGNATTGLADRATAAAGTGGSAGGGALSNITGAGLLKSAPLLLAGATLMGGLAGAGKPKAAGAPAGSTDPNMTAHLPQVTFDRTYQPYQGDYRRYAMDSGGHDFFSNNALPGVKTAAEGGYMSGYGRGGVSGPGDGREDKIPALLSDGEYILDAETVALLGDGSSKAGAQKLDELRQSIRQQKGKALARGQMSPDARPALAYLKGGR